MQILIASSLLLALSAYLLHQFLQRSLSAPDESEAPLAQSAGVQPAEAPEQLKAA